MQLLIKHKLKSELVLPIGYHHILQSIIYKNIKSQSHLSDFIHNEGYIYKERQYRMFTFSLLEGKYAINNGRISFRDEVQFEVRSPEHSLIRILKENIDKNGIYYPDTYIKEVELVLKDEHVDESHIRIKMVSPLSVYSTDPTTKQTHFYEPNEELFSVMVNENFKRKYAAYTGIYPESDITIKPSTVLKKDKYVTKYKGFYISGWKGEYQLSGEKKHLDFLYQTGIGAKNSQGFGLFELK